MKEIKDMSSLGNILIMESSVAEENRSKHHEEISKCNEIIDLYAEVWDYLKGKDFDLHTNDGASKAIVWRFSCSIPSDLVIRYGPIRLSMLAEFSAKLSPISPRTAPSIMSLFPVSTVCSILR